MRLERYEILINALLDRELNVAEQAELQKSLRASPAARECYWQSLMQDSMLREMLRETRGQDLALVEAAADQDSEPAVLVEPQHTAPARAAWPRIMAWSSLAAVLLIGLFWWSNSAAYLGAPLGKLQSLSGQVTIRQANGRLTPAISGALVRYGQAILVDADESSAKIELDNGSTLHVEADSVLVLPSSAAVATTALEHARPRFYLERGGMTVQANLQPAQQPLLFTTAQALIRVLGTDFRLYSDAHESRLELNEGSVEFCRQSDQQEIVVSAGEYATIPTKLINDELQPLEAKSLSTATCELRQTLLRAGRALRLNADGQKLATVRGRQVRIWNVATGELLQQLTDVSNPPEQIAFTTDNSTLIGMNQRGHLLHWPLVQPKPRHQQLPEETTRLAYLASDGSVIAQAITSKPARLQLWKIPALGNEQVEHQSFPAKPWSVAVSPAGPQQSVASAQWNGEIQLFDLASGQLLETWKGIGSARPIETSSRSRFVASYSDRQGLMLYQRKPAQATESREGRCLWSHMGSRVRCLRFSHDEKIVVAAFEDGLVRAWSTKTGEMLLVLQTGDPKVFDLDLSRDGRTMVTVGHNDTVKIWECVWPEFLEGV